MLPQSTLSKAIPVEVHGNQVHCLHLRVTLKWTLEAKGAFQFAFYLTMSILTTCIQGYCKNGNCCPISLTFFLPEELANFYILHVLLCFDRP